MHPLIRIAFALLFLCLACLNSSAGTDAVSPVKAVAFQNKNIRKLDSFLMTRTSIVTLKKASELTAIEATQTDGKICSCQILNLESSNYDHPYVVLLAEKTIDGSSDAFDIARNSLEKEKKHLKDLFYDKVKVVSEVQGTGSCKAMFFRLNSADKNLKLYEILNADIY